MADSIQQAFEALKAKASGEKVSAVQAIEAKAAKGAAIRARREADRKRRAQKAELPPTLAAQVISGDITVPEAVEKKTAEEAEQALLTEIAEREEQLFRLCHQTFLGRVVKDKAGNVIIDEQGRPRVALNHPWARPVPNKHNLYLRAKYLARKAAQTPEGAREFSEMLMYAQKDQEHWADTAQYVWS